MSTYVVYSSLGLPAPPVPVLQAGLVHTWTGWDGTSFDLTEGTAGVLLLTDGVTGLHLPELDQQLDEHTSVDGARYRGTRTRYRQPSWVLLVYGEGSAEFRDRDRAFWHTLHADRPGLWTVTDTTTGQSRTLLCRLRSASEHEYPRDPVFDGWAVYTVDLIAEQPYWEGAPVASPLWTFSGTGTPFTGPDDAAPSYHISAASLIGGAAPLTNTGDVDAYLTWQVTGPITSVTITGAAGQLGYGSLLAGQTLKITTDPTLPVALVGDSDVTGQVVPWDPRPIPPGETSTVTIQLVGTGTVQASFTPRYRRAW